MKLLSAVFVSVLLFPVLSLKAQHTIQSTGSVKSVIEYQWPIYGDTRVPQAATFVIRPSKFFMNGKTAMNFSFDVTGEKSGLHTGKILISDDNQTIIFKPELPFALKETVHVTFIALSAENFTSYSYSFQITSLTQENRIRALQQLNERGEAEIENAQGAPPAQAELPLPVSNDSLTNLLPVHVVIDKAIVHEPENIFCAITGQSTFAYYFAAIISDTGSNALSVISPIASGVYDFKMQPDGNLTYFRQLYYVPLSRGIFAGRHERLGPDMKLIDTFQCVGGYIADGHDFRILPNGHAILESYDPDTTDMVALLQAQHTPHFDSLALKASTKARKYDAVIQELDKDKNLVFQWNSKDHYTVFDAAKDISLTDTIIDYMHCNAAIRDSVDGNIIASFRHQDEIVKINRSDTGSFIWRWGGKHNQIAFVGGDTLPFSHQHAPVRIGTNHIMLFDNGNLHTPPSTRVVEYVLDEATHTATSYWEFKGLPYCLAAGNAQRLDNGNTFMGLGIISKPTCMEVTNTGDTVFEMSVYTSGAFGYKSYRFPFIPLAAVRQTGNANSFSIVSIYPNPAQNSATISFSVADPGMMQIQVLDVLGHTVRSMTEKLPNAGTYSADLDLHTLPNGTYYCKLSQNGNTAIKMVVVQK